MEEKGKGRGGDEIATTNCSQSYLLKGKRPMLVRCRGITPGRQGMCWFDDVDCGEGDGVGQVLEHFSCQVSKMSCFTCTSNCENESVCEGGECMSVYVRGVQGVQVGVKVVKVCDELSLQGCACGCV